MSLNKQYFDVSHWHVFRVYPFFWLLPAKKHIISIHDAGHYLLPYTQTFYNKVFMFIIKKNLTKIHKIIVLSENAKSNLINFGKFPENKIAIMYPGSNFSSIVSSNHFDKQNILKSKSYIVCVSRWQPHKNVEGLIDGFYKFLRNNPETNTKLVLVGKPVANYDVPGEKIKEYGLNSKVITLFDLNDSELSWLYENAIFSVFPSVHEGFGLPVLESLIKGCPVIVDTNTSTAEVVGNAGVCVNMKDSTELATAMQQLLADSHLLNKLKHNSKIVAEQFSWDNTFRKLLEIYQ